jgi:beta-alanine degradation protein BauB
VAKCFWTVLFSCLAFSVALAQDPTKVEPTHYKLDFENDHVQVVFVHYGPHERSVLHQHPQGVIVNLTDGHLRMTDAKGKVREVYSKRGEARWSPPFRHMVENLTDESYSAVYVGVKTKASTASGSKPGAVDEQTAKILTDLMLAAQAKPE